MLTFLSLKSFGNFALEGNVEVFFQISVAKPLLNERAAMSTAEVFVYPRKGTDLGTESRNLPSMGCFHICLAMTVPLKLFHTSLVSFKEFFVPAT